MPSHLNCKKPKFNFSLIHMHTQTHRYISESHTFTKSELFSLIWPKTTTWAVTANDTTKTSPNILTLLVLQKIIDGGNSSLALYRKAKSEKSKGQMKKAFILLPDSPYSLLLNVSQLSLPSTVGRITEFILESFVNKNSLFKSNQSIVQIEGKQLSSNGIAQYYVL